MNSEDILRTLGLSQKETAIYLTLLETGPATLAKVAQNANLHRPIVYKTLPLLQERGLVSTMPRGKQTLYIAESPEKLEGILEHLKVQFAELIPQLKSAYRSTEDKPVVKHLDGKKGIMFVFDDLVTVLKRGDIFYRYSSARDVANANAYLPPRYRERRDAKQLERLVIVGEHQVKTKRPRLERDMKIIPEEYDPFTDDITEIIYANKVAFIDYNSETATLIENKKFADFQRKLFILLYRKL